MGKKPTPKSTDNILDNIKGLLGIQSGVTHFDPEIIIHINSVFMILNQLGVGPEQAFVITDNKSKWENFLENNTYDLEAIKTYIYLRVRLIFDPPSSSFVLESIQRTISELEWRLEVIANKKEDENNE